MKPDWTFDQWLAWARKERDARKTELAKMDSAESLKRIQAATKKRRNSVGLSAGQAANAVRAADMADSDMLWKAKDLITWPVKAAA